jgi:hypothetical protein
MILHEYEIALCWTVEYLQLPPQIRTLSLLERLMLRQRSEKRASQAVQAASGTVAAAGGETLEGTLNEIFSSARVHVAKAPRPLISPA